MPEGHTVHRLADAFEARFVGRSLAASSPQGRFAEGAARLDGRKLAAVEAHGKQMFLDFGRDTWLRVHLGLYGMWRFGGPGLAGYGRRGARGADPSEIAEPRGAVRLRLLGRANVADLSGPTACELIDAAGKRAAQAKLGEDPLRDDADPDRAFATLHRSRQPIGQMLMRQDVVAGIGNIYRAEILFRARLDPYTPSRDVPEPTWRAMWDDLATLMGEGVRTGRIVTVDRKRRDGDGAAARRGAGTYVSHRAGKPCRICGEPVSAAPMAGRRLYWCRHCQPAAP